jgi:hypothetical protein
MFEVQEHSAVKNCYKHVDEAWHQSFLKTANFSEVFSNHSNRIWCPHSKLETRISVNYCERFQLLEAICTDILTEGGEVTRAG